MTRLFIDGRLDESIALLERLDELTEASGSISAAQSTLLTTVFLCLGRLEEAHSFVTRPARPFPICVALCYAYSGRLAEAQRLLSDTILLLDTDAADLELVSTYLLLMLEISVLVEDRSAAAMLSARLAGLAHLAGTYRTPSCVARHLGTAAALLGKPDEARAYYDQAVEVCTKVRFRPDLALTRLGLAELLLELYPDERDTAIEHLDFAIREFQEMKMQPSLERALRHRGLLKA